MLNHLPNSILVPAWGKWLIGPKLIRIFPRPRSQAGLRNLDPLQFVLIKLDTLAFLPVVLTTTPLSSPTGLQDSATQRHRC
jgi:hypothetical protein